jgi:acetyl esterase/lipase
VGHFDTNNRYGAAHPVRLDRMTTSRRQLLVGAAGLLGIAALSGCGHASPNRRATPAATSHPAGLLPRAGSTRLAYGSDPAQYGDLYLPTGTARPGVAVIIHGGFWLAEYDASLGIPMAQDLVSRGYSAFNLEYRRVGNGGGWPTTLQDVADGIDRLDGPDVDLDLSRVVLIGHSAGGQLAAWAAGRAKLAAAQPGAAPKVAARGVVSQAGVLDLSAAVAQHLGGSAVTDLLGGTPSQVPARYDSADPMRQLPLGVPVLCVHSRRDQAVPFSQSEDYVAAARAAGGAATLTEVPGDHMDLIDPSSPAWLAIVRALPGLLGG